MQCSSCLCCSSRPSCERGRPNGWPRRSPPQACCCWCCARRPIARPAWSPPISARPIGSPPRRPSPTRRPCWAAGSATALPASHRPARRASSRPSSSALRSAWACTACCPRRPASRPDETLRAMNTVRPWRLVCALGLAQIVSWGSYFYAFALLMKPLQQRLDCSATAVVGAFSLALLVAGLLAAPVGAWIDRHGGRGLMSLGSLAGALLLALLPLVHTLAQLYLVWA